MITKKEVIKLITKKIFYLKILLKLGIINLVNF